MVSGGHILRIPGTAQPRYAGPNPMRSTNAGILIRDATTPLRKEEEGESSPGAETSDGPESLPDEAGAAGGKSRPRDQCGATTGSSRSVSRRTTP